MTCKVLNLYCGLGGNRKLWKNVKVTAVEMNSQILDVYAQNHPNDILINGDAHDYLINHFSEFDFIWSSPPCQSHSRMTKFTRHNICQYPDLRLYEEILFLKHFFKGKWVVENVIPYYDPLVEPTTKIGRHLFWSNFRIKEFTEKIKTPDNFIKLDTVAGSKILKEWLGIKYPGNIYYSGNHSPSQVLRNCVHPLIGNFVFKSKRNGRI